MQKGFFQYAHDSNIISVVKNCGTQGTEFATGKDEMAAFSSAEAGRSRLHKSLRFPDLFSIATGAMISSGLFVLPGLAYLYAGPAAVAAYILAGIVILPALFGKAELATAMPKAGGDYYFIDRSLGHMAGTIAGIAAWVSLSIKTAFAFVGIKVFLEVLVPDINSLALTLAALIVFTFLNLRGASHAGKAQILMVAGLLVILLAFSIVGNLHTTAARMVPFAPKGMKGIVEATALIFVAFGGLTKAASVAEEAANPKRDIPLAMIASLTVVTFLYFTSVTVCVGTLDGNTLSASMTPLSDAAETFAGKTGFVILALAAVFAFLSTANAGIMASARFPLAMSRDRLIPSVIGRVGLKRGTPWFSIVLTSIFIASMLFLDFVRLVKMASAMQILLFMMTSVVVIVMRESRIHTYRPTFKSPLYPWMQIAGTASMFTLLLMIGLDALIACSAVTLGGVVWYFIYSGARVQRDSALLHLAARIFPGELKHRNESITRELKSVLMERDIITEDRFDILVLESDIIDVAEPMELTGFLHLVADTIAPSLQMLPDDLFRLLVEREKVSPTALRPGLAIPHIVVPGTGKFTVNLARCTGGINFGNPDEPVHTVFILAGTMDQRNFHLKALMAIAEITTAHGFDELWKKCRTGEELRDLVLLSHRRREGT
jgi:amino acid transporter/mannitol/fructose-specific phosphotransferase system IIA component (Ntr-type)